MKIFISAAEISSDKHGAKLVQALIAKFSPTKLDIFGIGGPELRAQGIKTIVPAENLLAMGSTEVLVRLPQILIALHRVAEAIKQERPSVAIFLDYPDFHMRLAKKIARLRIPSVYYIPPKVWIWRKDRIEIIKKYFSKILCVFPFEEEFFKNEGVSQAKYVGNPILEELPFSMTRSQARQNMNLASNDLVFTIMPGSRPAEMWNHSLPLLRAVKLAEKELSKRHMIHAQRKLKILVPIVNGMENFFSGFDFSGSSLIEIKLLQHNAHKCLIASDAALVKSGTSTLEAALLGCPYTLFYKPSWMTACIFQYFLKYKGPVGLVNILLGKKNSEDYAVKEILGSEVNAKNLSYEIVQLLVNSEKQNELKKSFLQVMDLLKTKEPPSQLAAHEIFDLVMH